MEEIRSRRNGIYYFTMTLYIFGLSLCILMDIVDISICIDKSNINILIISQILLFTTYSVIMSIGMYKFIKAIPNYIFTENSFTSRNKTYYYRDMIEINFNDEKKINKFFVDSKKCFTIKFKDNTVINIFYYCYKQKKEIKQFLERQISIINSNRTIA